MNESVPYFAMKSIDASLRYIKESKRRMRLSTMAGISVMSGLGHRFKIEQLESTADLMWQVDEQTDHLDLRRENDRLKMSNFLFGDSNKDGILIKSQGDEDNSQTGHELHTWIKQSIALEQIAKAKLGKYQVNPIENLEYDWQLISCQLDDKIRMVSDKLDEVNISIPNLDLSIALRLKTIELFNEKWLKSSGVDVSDTELKRLNALVLLFQLADDFGSIEEDLKFGIPGINRIIYDYLGDDYTPEREAEIIRLIYSLFIEPNLSHSVLERLSPVMRSMIPIVGKALETETEGDRRTPTQNVIRQSLLLFFGKLDQSNRTLEIESSEIS